MHRHTPCNEPHIVRTVQKRHQYTRRAQMAWPRSEIYITDNNNFFLKEGRIYMNNRIVLGFMLGSTMIIKAPKGEGS
jgi:hypothetical protein